MTEPKAPPTTSTSTNKPGRPRSGSLYWAKSGWRARLRVEVDGVTVQKSFALGTKDKAVARIKMRKLAGSLVPVAAMTDEAAKSETFEQAAGRIVGESGIRTADARLARLRLRVFPAIGNMRVDEIRAGDVRDILNTLAGSGASRQSCVHLRNDISAVLGELWRFDILTENVCKKVKIPKNAKVDKRERAVIPDHKLAVYLAWEHPVEKRRASVLERQVMACIVRMFGGLRWGDIRALRWEAFETAHGRFDQGWAPREKTASPQKLVVPEMLRPILRDWWERAGRPTEGLMFPARRGPRAGEKRKAGSIAKALRRDLARAWGIEVLEAVDSVRKNGRPDVRYRWVKRREPDAEELPLLAATEFTLPVDFHSGRRAYKQALADAGVELITAMALSGANDVKSHQRYLPNTAKAREIPAAALPNLSIVHAQSDFGSNENTNDSQYRESDLNRRPHAYEARALTS